MGLDICLYKIQPLAGRDPEKIREEEYANTTNLHVHYIDESQTEFMEFFKDFVFESKEPIYDLEGLLAEQGYTWEDIDRRDDDYSYRDDGFHPGDFQFIMKDGKVLTFNNARTILAPYKGCVCEEVGYQRKGANRAFYADDMWDSADVFKMETLLEHWEKYFSGEGNVKKEGGIKIQEGKVSVEEGVPWGFGVEYDNTAEENRKRFKENIIDNFVQGETFVVYC